MTLPAPQQDQPMLTYKLSLLEQDLARLREQLNLYVPARENDLQLQNIQETVSRIEYDLGETKKQIGEIDNKLILQREALDKLQIKALWSIVSIVLSGLSAIFVGYITHFFH